MRRHLRLYAALLIMNLKVAEQFPGQTLFQVGLSVLFEGLQLAFLWVVVDHFGSVGGWTFWEVAMLLALRSLSHIAYAQFFWTGGLDTAVIRGELDKFLVRPMNPLVHFLADHEQSLARLPSAAFALALIGIAAWQIPVDWTPLKALGFVLGFTGGVFIWTGIQLLGSCLAFWTKREDTLTVLIPWSGDIFTQYPLHIYGSVVQAVLTFVIPFAFINFVPVAFVIDRGGDLLFSPLLVFAAPVVGAALMALGGVTWSRGLRVYESAGT